MRARARECVCVCVFCSSLLSSILTVLTSAKYVCVGGRNRVQEAFFPSVPTIPCDVFRFRRRCTAATGSSAGSATTAGWSSCGGAFLATSRTAGASSPAPSRTSSRCGAEHLSLSGSSSLSFIFLLELRTRLYIRLWHFSRRWNSSTVAQGGALASVLEPTMPQHHAEVTPSTDHTPPAVPTPPHAPPALARVVTDAEGHRRQRGGPRAAHIQPTKRHHHRRR